jgi:hypothetical protein
MYTISLFFCNQYIAFKLPTIVHRILNILIKLISNEINPHFYSWGGMWPQGSWHKAWIYYWSQAWFWKQPCWRMALDGQSWLLQRWKMAAPMWSNSNQSSTFLDCWTLHKGSWQKVRNSHQISFDPLCKCNLISFYALPGLGSKPRIIWFFSFISSHSPSEQKWLPPIWLEILSRDYSKCSYSWYFTSL